MVTSRIMFHRIFFAHAMIAAVIITLLAACGARQHRVADEGKAPGPDLAETAASAPETGLSVEELVKTLFESHGVADEVLENTRTMLDLYEVIVQILPPRAEEALALAAEGIDELSTRERLLQPAREHFLAHADPSKLAAAVAWKETEVGGKWATAMRDGLAGRDAGEQEAHEWLMSFHGSVDDDPALGERAAALQAFEESSEHAERSLDLMQELGHLLLDAFSSTLPDPIQPREEHVQAVAGSLESAMRQPAFMDAVFDSYLFATRNLTVDELRMVVSFHEDGPGRWLLDVLEGANRKAGEAYARALAENLASAWRALAEKEEEEAPAADSETPAES